MYLEFQHGPLLFQRLCMVDEYVLLMPAVESPEEPVTTPINYQH